MWTREKILCVINAARHTLHRGLSLHVKTKHEGKFSYTCNVCKKGFWCKRSYQDHVNKHAGVNLRCHKCSKSFSGTFAVKKHMQTSCNPNVKTFTFQRAHAHLTLAPFPQSILHSFQSSLTSNQNVWYFIYSQSKKISNDQELIQSDPTSCPQNQKGNN